VAEHGYCKSNGDPDVKVRSHRWKDFQEENINCDQKEKILLREIDLAQKGPSLRSRC